MSRFRAPFVRSILHASDISPASHRAFAHALALALMRQTRLTILHVGRDRPTRETWMSFPGVRDTLVRWGILDEGAARYDVYEKLNVDVEKIALRDRDRARAIIEFLQDHPADLVVLSTEGRDGPAQWLKPSVAERAARGSSAMTLFVPKHARGFVALEDGDLHMKRILVPVDDEPEPDAALELAVQSAKSFGEGDVEITLLHVGEEMPELKLPEGDDWCWRKLVVYGDVVEQIVQTASGADLIVMPTERRTGVLDALHGTTTEKVLRRAPCPLLAVPSR